MEIKNLVKTIINPIRFQYQKWRHNSPLKYSFEGVEVNVLPGIYSPIMYSSTSLFLKYIQELDLTNKTILELGCGSGVISAYCASQGGLVTASDVNELAIGELSVQARDKNWNIISVYSDLFENIQFHFDYIFINPPIAANNAKSVIHLANFCGANFEYYDRLFEQLKIRTLRDSQVLLFLPEEAELFAICRRAKHHHLTLKTQRVISSGLNKGMVYRVMALV